ncbi:MAG: hypothetical protein ACLQLC_05930 [Candidatus Sulfotelmatobacter sp.]
MKSKITSLCIAVSLLLLAVASTAVAQTPTQKSFEQLKSLTGSWQGKNSEGKPLTVTFESTGGGSALMSEIRGGEHKDSMISMFHLDGPNRLMLTHYCTAGNQPRFQATVPPDGKTFTFDYVDATNLAGPDAGHMQRVVFTMLDENHHTEDWTFAAGRGKEMKEFFDLRRAEVAQK